MRRRPAPDLIPVDVALAEVLRLPGRLLRKHGVTADLALGLAGVRIQATARRRSRW